MERVKRIEHVVVNLLYYTRGVDNTCLFSLSTTSTINDPTDQDEKNAHQFLDYMETSPSAGVRFHTSDMILLANTNESYLTGPEALSCAVGSFF